MAAEELCVSSLKDTKKNDYKKAFVKVLTWKKADGVLFLLDYKLEGKKTFVAIPYKKIKLAKDEYEEVKKTKKHPLKKTAFCSFELNKEGNLATLDLKKGGVAAEALQEKAEAAFSAMGIAIKVTGTSEDAAEVAKEPEVIDTDDAPVVKPAVTKEDLVALLQKMAASVKEISAEYGEIKKVVVANVKANLSKEDDLKWVESILSKIQMLKALYDSAPKAVKEKIAKEADAILGNIQPQMQKLLDKLEFSVFADADNRDLYSVVKKAQETLKNFKADIIKLEADITKKPTPTPPNGQELLDILK